MTLDNQTRAYVAAIPKVVAALVAQGADLETAYDIMETLVAQGTRMQPAGPLATLPEWAKDRDGTDVKPKAAPAKPKAAPAERKQNTFYDNVILGRSDKCVARMRERKAALDSVGQHAKDGALLHAYNIYNAYLDMDRNYEQAEKAARDSVRTMLRQNEKVYKVDEKARRPLAAWAVRQVVKKDWTPADISA